jgi:hypothetical protein
MPLRWYRWALVIRAFAARFFTYQLIYFTVMSYVSILSAATTEAASQVHRVPLAFSLTRPTILTPRTTIEGLLWCIRKPTGVLYVFRFTRFRYKR